MLAAQHKTSSASRTRSVLQCVAVCCSVLQCVEVCCSVFGVRGVDKDIGEPTLYSSSQVSLLQCFEVCCRLLQSVFQCVWFV